MRKNRVLETCRDRKALARDAGLSPVSTVSALAGTLSGYGAAALLLVIAGLIAGAVNGGSDFGGVSATRVKDVTAVIVVAAIFLAFVFGGYTAGRMSRRSGSTNGVIAGILGIVLGAVVVVLVRAGGGGASLSRVATNLNVPSTWSDWRAAGLVCAVISAVAMILGGLIGGAAGERWHATLLARAVDSSYGPEAEQLAVAQKQAEEAKLAHIAAQERVARATAVSSFPGRPTVAEPADGRRGDRSVGAEPTVVDQAAADRGGPRPDDASTAAMDPEATPAGTPRQPAGAGTRARRRHLLHR